MQEASLKSPHPRCAKPLDGSAMGWVGHRHAAGTPIYNEPTRTNDVGAFAASLGREQQRAPAQNRRLPESNRPSAERSGVHRSCTNASLGKRQGPVRDARTSPCDPERSETFRPAALTSPPPQASMGPVVPPVSSAAKWTGR